MRKIPDHLHLLAQRRVEAALDLQGAIALAKRALADYHSAVMQLDAACRAAAVEAPESPYIYALQAFAPRDRLAEDERLYLTDEGFDVR